MYRLFHEVRVKVSDAHCVNEVSLSVKGQRIGKLTVNPFAICGNDLANACVVNFISGPVGRR